MTTLRASVLEFLVSSRAKLAEHLSEREMLRAKLVDQNKCHFCASHGCPIRLTFFFETIIEI